MITIDNKGTYLVKNGQKHDNVIYERPLISMARMQSARSKKARKIEKVVTPAQNWTGDLLIS